MGLESIFIFVLTTIGSVVYCLSDEMIYSNSTESIDSLENIVFSAIKRGPRFINFKTIEEDMKLAFEFHAPFILIPYKKDKNSEKSLTMLRPNVNVAALVLTGVTVAAAVGLSSVLSYFGNLSWNKIKTESTAQNYRNFLDFDEENSVWRAFQNIEDTFNNYNIDLGSCLQKTVCILVKRSFDKIKNGNASSLDKILDGISSSEWINRKLSGTAIHEAIDAGKKLNQCSNKYETCKINGKRLIDYLGLN